MVLRSYYGVDETFYNCNTQNQGVPLLEIAYLEYVVQSQSGMLPPTENAKLDAIEIEMYHLNSFGWFTVGKRISHISSLQE